MVKRIAATILLILLFALVTRAWADTAEVVIVDEEFDPPVDSFYYMWGDTRLVTVAFKTERFGSLSLWEWTTIAHGGWHYVRGIGTHIDITTDAGLLHVIVTDEEAVEPVPTPSPTPPSPPPPLRVWRAYLPILY